MPVKRKLRGLVQPKKKTRVNPNKKTDLDYDVDSEIDSDAVSTPEESENEEENEEKVEIETAEEKRARLAKEYLKSVEDGIDSGSGSGSDSDLDKDEEINEKLRESVLESTGKINHKYGDKIKDIDLSLQFYRGHDKPITCVSLCKSDDKHGYSGSKDCNIIHWDIETGQKISKIKGIKKNKHNSSKITKNIISDEILSICVSNDNRMLAAGGRDKIIRLYDVRNNEFIDSFIGHHQSINSLKFTDDNKTLYSGSEDGTIKSWNVVDKCYIETLYGHESMICNIDIINNDRILSSGRDNTNRLFKIIDESQLIFRGLKKGVNMERISHITNEYFVSGTESGEINLWNITKKKPILTTQATESSRNYILSLDCLINSDLCVTGSWDGYIKFWKIDLFSKQIECVNKIKQDGFINDLAISRNGVLFGAISQEHRLGRWFRNSDVKNGVFVVKLPLNQ